MKNIIFIAPPASGKGTLSNLLKENFNYKHLSTGDILRDEVDSGNEEVKNLIENGQLVSDELIMSLINKKISNLVDTPFILDGCPRTLKQVHLLDEVIKNLDLKNIIVVKLNIDLDTAKKRILGRRNCKCGKTYNVYIDELKPRVEDVCDNCGASLYQRSDDTEEKIVVRFNEYEKNIKPIAEFYKNEGILHEMDATGELDKIFESLKEIIND